MRLRGPAHCDKGKGIQGSGNTDADLLRGIPDDIGLTITATSKKSGRQALTGLYSGANAGRLLPKNAFLAYTPSKVIENG